MSDGTGSSGPPSRPPSPGGKRPGTIGLQLKLPCATMDEVRARYGEELGQSRFFIRTRQPRPRETVVRLEVQLQTGGPCFKAAGVVVRVQEPPAPGETAQPGQDAGMALQLLAVDEAGRQLILSLGGKPPPPLRADIPARPSNPSQPKMAPVPSVPPPAAAPPSPLPPPATTPARGSGPVSAPPRAVTAPPRTASGPLPRVTPASTLPATSPPASAPPPSVATTPVGSPAAVPAAGAAAAAPAGSAPASPGASAPSATAPGHARPAAPLTTPRGVKPVSAARAPAPARPVSNHPSGFGDDLDPPLPPESAAAPSLELATVPEVEARPVPMIDPATQAAVAAAAAESAATSSTPGEIDPSVPRKGPIVGIDLGTTNSCVAIVQRGKPLVIPSREGYNTIPSIVAVNEKGKVIVGHPAKGQMLTNPRNTVFGAKRLIGRQFSSQVVSDLMGRFPYEIVAGTRGEAAVLIGNQQLSLQRISAMVLGEVKEIAQQYLKTQVTRAVITVPAYYNDNQRQAVRQAGAMAGLHVERILNEPTAAALAFAHGRKLDQRVLVYDLGGGTFDASVLELRGNIYEVVSTGGDTFLGGTDFDKVLVDHLLEGFKEQHKIDFPGDRVALQRVTDAAERAKIALSESIEYDVRVPFIAMVSDKPYDLEQTIQRSELVLLTGHLIDRTLQVCGEVLEARGLKPSDIDEVLLVGGQSRMPLVRERIRSFFGREPSRAVHPDEAVALGAALLAHHLDSPDIEGVVLVDVLPMSIGVGLPGGRFKKVIDRNTALPHKRTLSISTSKDDQRELEISVFQGESERAQENEYLGTLLVPDIPKGARGTRAFDIEFSLSPECLLTISGVDKKSGAVTSATFSTQDTPEAVRKKLEGDAERPGDAGPQQAGGGFFGWVKRLFGGRPENRA